MDTKPVNQYIADRIRETRQKTGLTQKQFAAIINKKQRAYSDCETGKVKIPAELLYIIAITFNEPITFFFPQQPFE